MMKHILIHTLLMTALCTFCSAQNKNELPTGSIKPNIEVAITPNVPTGTSRVIAQDRNGNIWIAAFDGVFKYDARLNDGVGQGKSFTKIEGLRTSYRFFSVLEDRQGNMWFASLGGGIYKYDGQSIQNFTTKDGIINNEVDCIYEDKTGNIWFGVNGGVSLYDARLKSFRNFMVNGDSMSEEKTGKIIPDFTRPSNAVNSIIEDKTGRIWFATRGKTFVYDGETFSVFADSPDHSNVFCMIKDSKGNIWFGGNGLWRYDGTTTTNFSNNPVTYICEDKAGNIWTSSQERGAWLLLRYDVKSLSDKKPTVTEISSHPIIWSIFQAADGSIWYGALGLHRYRYDGKTITHFKSKEAQY